MKVGVIVAMEMEYSSMLSLLGGSPRGMINGNEIILRRSGIGKVNAAIGAFDLIRTESPDCIISTGVAGGIGDDVHVMDAVAGAQVVYHDVWCGEGNEYGQVQGLPVRFDGADFLLSCAKSAVHSVRMIGGLICSGDQFITDRDQERAILARFPDAKAVDMESGAIAQVCHICSVPFLSFRIISDSLCDCDDDHQKQYDNFWGTVGDTSFNAVREFLMALPH